MTKKEEKEEKQIRQSIFEIYHNYGIDTSDMEDDDIREVVSHYRKNPKSLSGDIMKSKKHERESAKDDV